MWLGALGSLVRPHAENAYSISRPDGISSGAVAFFQGYFFTAVLAGLMSAFLMVRHIRADEDQSRFELVGSTQVTKVTSLRDLALCHLGKRRPCPCPGRCRRIHRCRPPGARFIPGGDSRGPVLHGTAALAGQAMPSARSANGTAAALVGGAYQRRGAGDALGTSDPWPLHLTADWPSLFSPIGWGQRIRPFTEADTLPLLVIGAVVVILAGCCCGASQQHGSGHQLHRCG